MKVASIKRSQKYPSWMKKHPIFSKVEKIEKIFPLIGLKNCSEKISNIDYVDVKLAAEYQKSLHTAFNPLYCYYDRSKCRTVRTILGRCKPSDFLINGKLGVPLAFQKQGITDFEVYIRECKISPSERRHYTNIKYTLQPINPNYKVVFSSDGGKGIWDIATMSMRGIYSCQSWDGCFRRNLIGSMVDPFVGIIYITDNTRLSRGSEMLYRAVVRYVVNRFTKKPAFMLEGIYVGDDIETDGNILMVKAIFVAFLKKKLGNKLPIITKRKDIRQYAIPNSKVVKTLATCGKYSDGKDYCRSYRDSGIAYSASSATHKKGIKTF